ncbi:MAG: DMT family transporter [Pseudomonadota bacterium]
MHVQVPPQFYASLSENWRNQSPEIRGIIFMCISTLCFSVMHVIIRYTSVNTDLHSYQIAFFRNVFGFFVFLPLLVTQGAGFLKTQRLGLHAFRSLFNIGAMLIFFYALSITEVAHVTALGFSAPIFAAVLSVVFLGERFRARRWLAIGFGILGMLVIARPGYIPIELGTVLVIVSAFFWAIVLTIIKVMSRTESSLTIVAYMNIFLAIYALGPAIWVWVWPTWEGWLLMIAIAIAGTCAQICVSQSLKEAEQTLVMPFDFLRLIWVAIIGYWVFGEIPDEFIWAGGAIIFASGVYLAYRERAVRRAHEASESRHSVN